MQKAKCKTLNKMLKPFMAATKQEVITSAFNLQDKTYIQSRPERTYTDHIYPNSASSR